MNKFYYAIAQLKRCALPMTVPYQRLHLVVHAVLDARKSKGTIPLYKQSTPARFTLVQQESMRIHAGGHRFYAFDCGLRGSPCSFTRLDISVVGVSIGNFIEASIDCAGNPLLIQPFPSDLRRFLCL